MYESKIELCNLTRVFLGVYVKCSSREGIKLIDACSDPVLTINNSRLHFPLDEGEGKGSHM